MTQPVQRIVAVESTPSAAASETTSTPDPYATETVPIAVPLDEPLLESPPPCDESAALAPEIRHNAELRGTVDRQAGNRLTIEPLVVTSATFPVPGNEAHLWVESKEEADELGWRHVARVRVVTTLRFGMPMEVEMVNDKPKRSAENLALATLPLGSKVRIQWEW
jgi:hypothetical protein